MNLLSPSSSACCQLSFAAMTASLVCGAGSPGAATAETATKDTAAIANFFITKLLSICERSRRRGAKAASRVSAMRPRASRAPSARVDWTDTEEAMTSWHSIARSSDSAV